MIGVSEGTPICDGVWVEDHNVGVSTRTEDPFVDESKPLSGEGGHLSNGILQTEEAVLTDILAQDAG